MLAFGMAYLRLRQDDLACSDVGGETVLLDLRSSTYFTAKGTGSFIITCLNEGVTEDELAERIVARYEVDLETARADLAEFLEQLDERQMLYRSEQPG
jgi:hypothetical protein